MNGTRILNANGTKGYSVRNTISGIKLIYTSVPESLEIIPKIPTDVVIQVGQAFVPLRVFLSSHENIFLLRTT